MDQYFGRMQSLMNNKDLPARIRFLLQDTMELRENIWVPRKAFIDNGPKTINQIRQDAVKVRRLGVSLMCSFSCICFGFCMSNEKQFNRAFFCQDLGVFIPPMIQGMRTDFFQEGQFLPTRIKSDRETLGGLADMFGQMPGMSRSALTFLGGVKLVFLLLLDQHFMTLFLVAGSGIGTGPGVIQDRYSPTMGRRANPLFNGHAGHMAPAPQPYIKSNQVNTKFKGTTYSMRLKMSAYMNCLF